jgi:hypothetical protein
MSITLSKPEKSPLPVLDVVSFSAILHDVTTCWEREKAKARQPYDSARNPGWSVVVAVCILFRLFIVLLSQLLCHALPTPSRQIADAAPG